MSQRLIVVWICHFSNIEVQNLLPLWHKTSEFAPWIVNMISGFEKRPDIELHIVAPHIYLIRDTTFKLRGVNYHFLSFGFPLINRPWPSFLPLDVKCGYPYITKKITKKVIKIKPDVVNLQGAENAYYSSSILQLRHWFPCIITIQGFASHMKNQHSPINKIRIKIEKEILSGFKYFYLDEDAINVVKQYSPDMIGKVVWWPAAELAIDQTPSIPYQQKVYDVLYVGRIEQTKGIEDFIKVVGLLKKSNPSIKACIIGSALPSYNEYLKKIAFDLNCRDNINFVGFVNTQKKMFSYFKNAKILLVPTLIDRYPSTIRESMRLKLPVIAYRTGSIPWTNKNGENIVLIEHGNVLQMASEATRLLNDRIRQEKLVSAASEFYEEEFSCEKNTDRFINGYHEVIKDFKQNDTIS